MLAAVTREWGGPEVVQIEEVDQPTPQSGYALVRVRACALNRADILMRNEVPNLRIQLPWTGGLDIVGWVDEVGDGVSSELIGKPVLIDPIISHHDCLGVWSPGGFAEFVTAPADKLIELASDDLLMSASVLPMAYGSGLHMLRARVGLSAGETVAIIGGAGGVGVACLQLAKMQGARVISCTETDEKAARLAELGADETINVSKEDFSSALWHMTDKRGADVIVNLLGGNWEEAIRATAEGGRIVTNGTLVDNSLDADIRYVWWREMSIVGANGWTTEELRDLVGWVSSGKLPTADSIHRIFPLSGLRDAFAEVEEHRAIGKVVVVPDAYAVA